MIPRYSRAQMSEIWTDETRFRIWLEVETLALEQMVQEGVAPVEALKEVQAKASFKAERVLEIEEQVKHDVIAFLTNISETVGPAARFLHRGMTSSDLLDTSFAVQLRRAGTLIVQGIDEALAALRTRIEEHRHTPCIGRSHGIHAEPTTFGVKLASWYAELNRNRERMLQAIEQISYGKISGAVGTYASVSPAVEAFVMQRLGLQPETVATQIVPRDRHAAFFNALALLASGIERAAVEVRHLQRTEVREAEEKFSVGQKGSSAMPHKRNPILSENLSGLARLVRGYAISAMENIPLWHERDISHSSVERVIAPDACIVVDFMLARFRSLISGLVVHEQRMRENLDYSRGLVFSGTLLIALVDHGVTREDAYRLVQKHALAAWDGGGTLQERILGDADILAQVPRAKLDAVFDLKHHFAHVDLNIDRALGGG